MITVVSVKFKGRGKTYYFDPGNLEVPSGVKVVVETSKGLELCECVQGNHIVTDERIVPPLRRVARLATADDLRIAELCKTREKEAFGICEQKIAQHGLDMKLVDVECNFEGNKMLFFFTSDGRVDFRELVKDLAGVFRTRIELRQIGVRDEAKMLGGIGMCGRPFCCNQFLDDFQPVSTKMAKTQSLSLNPTKISGCCGRLMCCLRYEQDAYEELVKTVPKNGAFVETVDGYGNVVQVNLLRQKVKVKLDGDNDNLHLFDSDEVAAVPGGRPRPGEPLPHVLQPRPKKKPEPEPEEEEWVLPPIFAEDTADTGNEEPRGPEEKRGESRRRRSRGKKPGAVQGGEKPRSAAEAQKEKQPQEKRPQEKSAEAAQSGAKKSGSRRRRRGGGHAGSAPKEAAPEQKKPAESAQPKGGDGGQKSSGSRRRHRPRGGHKGGGSAAPKAE